MATGLLSYLWRWFWSITYGRSSRFLLPLTDQDAAEREISMTVLKNYRDLDAWQVAMTLVETTYKLTRLLPDSERYGLISQMQRSAVPIPSNIAGTRAGNSALRPSFHSHRARLLSGIGNIGRSRASSSLCHTGDDKRLRLATGSRAPTALWDAA